MPPGLSGQPKRRDSALVHLHIKGMFPVESLATSKKWLVPGGTFFLSQQGFKMSNVKNINNTQKMLNFNFLSWYRPIKSWCYEPVEKLSSIFEKVRVKKIHFNYSHRKFNHLITWS